MSLNGARDRLTHSLAAAEHYLEHRPEDHLRAPSRFRAAGRLARWVAWRVVRDEELAARAEERARLEELRRRQSLLDRPAAAPPRAPVELAEPLPMEGLVEVDTDVGTLWMAESDVLIRPPLEEHGLLGSAMATLIRELEPGMTFVDVGAHVGYYALMAARAVGPTGRVVCVEPNPENLMLLRANLWRNSAAQAQVLPVAAWWERDHFGLLVYPEGGAASELVSEGTEIVVPCGRLDELVSGPIDLLKIDVERADHYVIRGATGNIRENPDLRIVAEFCPGALDVKGEGAREIIEEWQRLGDLALVAHDIRPATPDEILEGGPVLDVLITPRRRAPRQRRGPAALPGRPRGLRARLAAPYTDRRRAFRAAADAAGELIDRARGGAPAGGIDLARTLRSAEVTSHTTEVGELLAPTGAAPPLAASPAAEAMRALLERTLRPGMTFVDVGADLGWWSIHAARLVEPGGLVLALEPDRRRRELLEANLWRHAWRSARVEGALPAATDGYMPAGDGSTLVPAGGLDALLGDARADVLRLAAGSDPRVTLEGAAPGLAQDALVLVETEADEPVTASAVALGLRPVERGDGFVLLRRGAG